MEDINENIQEIINLKFENKFEDEYFKLHRPERKMRQKYLKINHFI
jgi:hypothetical protein